MLPDFMSFRRSFGDGNEQVLDFFVVDLHHRDHDLVLSGFVVISCDPVEYLLAGNRHYALSYCDFTLFAPYPTIE